MVQSLEKNAHDAGARSDGASLADIVAELRPEPHSQWAWDNYDATVLHLASRFNLDSLCEIGGGRDPLFPPDHPGLARRTVTINDIDAHELSLAPQRFRKACFDIGGDIEAAGVQPAQFDLCYSRMVFEHVRDVGRAWRNLHGVLKPGGVALAFFPTLYCPPFVANLMMPESLSSAIVAALFPNRGDSQGDPKFPAFYDHCYSAQSRIGPVLRDAGFEEFVIVPFWGHDYFRRLPGLRQADDALNRIAARKDWRALTSYAFVVARKAGDERLALAA
jgi:SAM-dependent methyltransferase